MSRTNLEITLIVQDCAKIAFFQKYVKDVYPCIVLGPNTYKINITPSAICILSHSKETGHLEYSLEVSGSIVSLGITSVNEEGEIGMLPNVEYKPENELVICALNTWAKIADEKIREALRCQ